MGSVAIKRDIDARWWWRCQRKNEDLFRFFVGNNICFFRFVAGGAGYRFVFDVVTSGTGANAMSADDDIVNEFTNLDSWEVLSEPHRFGDGG